MCNNHKTYLVVTVSIPSGDNETERRYKDGSSLRRIVHKEISAPPLFVPGMYITVDGGGEKISTISWDEDRRELSLYANDTISYHGQGPENLTGQDKIIAYFERYIQSYLNTGWIIGNPPR